MKKILFFSCEPGGAEVLVPVINLFTSRQEYEVQVVSYGYGASQFFRSGISYMEISPVEKHDRSVVEKYRPDLLITSACSMPEQDMSEKYLWYQARQIGIKTIAFLDQWQNYVIRFSGNSEQEKMAYLPDFINCINEIGRQEMGEKGFGAERLIIFGHPSLSMIPERIKAINVAGIKDKLGIAHDYPVVLFVSEPLREYYALDRGYDQYEALEMVVNVVKKSIGKAIVIVKLHPKDRLENFNAIQLRLKEQHHLIFVTDELSPIECNGVADYVFGMSSVMLIEAYLMSKLVVSVQPNLRIEDPCVLSKYGYIPLIENIGFDILNIFMAPQRIFECHFRINEFLEFVMEVLQ